MFTGSAFVHFLVVELRSLYLWYFSARSIVLKIGLEVYTYGIEIKGETVDSVSIDVLGEQHFEVLGEYIACLKNGIHSAVLALDVSYTSEAQCVKYHEDNYLPLFLLPAFTITVVFFLVCTGFFLNYVHWHTDFRSGHYLAFTWRLEQMIVYKACVAAMVAWIVLAIVGLFALSCGLVESLSAIGPLGTIRLVGADALVLMLSAYGLSKSQHPDFDWEDGAFQGSVLTRSRKDLVMQTNDQLGTYIEKTVCKAKLGSVSELELILGETMKWRSDEDYSSEESRPLSDP